MEPHFQVTEMNLYLGLMYLDWFSENKKGTVSKEYSPRYNNVILLLIQYRKFCSAISLMLLFRTRYPIGAAIHQLCLSIALSG
ncbi:hypothetical protein SAMN05518672_10333 [Chitinophaga sp. CF118]|nr:hypothetical protein SAMN05518672_10333 [Chitinophaga sp. CF118]